MHNKVQARIWTNNRKRHAGHLGKQTKVVTQSIQIKKLLLTCVNQLHFKTTASCHMVVALKSHAADFNMKQHPHIILTSMMLLSETNKDKRAGLYYFNFQELFGWWKWDASQPLKTSQQQLLVIWVTWTNRPIGDVSRKLLQRWSNLLHLNEWLPRQTSFDLDWKCA